MYAGDSELKICVEVYKYVDIEWSLEGGMHVCG